MALSPEGEKVYYEFIQQNEQSIAVALKGMWSKDNPLAKLSENEAPSDEEFTGWARELVRDRKMTLSHSKDPTKKFDIKIEMLQEGIDGNQKARDYLLTTFKTDNLDDVILDSDKVHKTASIVGNAADRAKPGIMDYIMGFMEWLIGKMSELFFDGKKIPGLTDFIKQRAVDKATSQVSESLTENAPEIHQGVRDRIVAQVNHKANQMAELPSEGEELRALADVRLGENAGPPATAPTATPVAPLATNTPAAPAVPVNGKAPSLDVVLDGMARNYLIAQDKDNTMTQGELEKNAKNVVRVVSGVINADNNKDLVGKRDFDTLSTKIAEAIMADPKMGQEIRQKAMQRFNQPVADEWIASLLTNDMKTQLQANQNLLVATVSGTPAVAGNNPAPVISGSPAPAVAPAWEPPTPKDPLPDVDLKRLMTNQASWGILAGVAKNVQEKYNNGDLFMGKAKVASEILNVYDRQPPANEAQLADMRQAQIELYNFAVKKGAAPDDTQRARIAGIIAETATPLLEDSYYKDRPIALAQALEPALKIRFKEREEFINGNISNSLAGAILGSNHGNSVDEDTLDKIAKGLSDKILYHDKDKDKLYEGLKVVQESFLFRKEAADKALMASAIAAVDPKAEIGAAQDATHVATNAGGPRKGPSTDAGAIPS